METRPHRTKKSTDPEVRVPPPMPGATIERTVSESVDLAPLEARVAILEKYSVQITGTLTELESRIVDLEEKLAEKD